MTVGVKVKATINTSLITLGATKMTANLSAVELNELLTILR